MYNLEYIEVSTSNTPNSSIIWLHGLGADGHDFESIVDELRLPEKFQIKFIFPHAPIQPVTINGGFPMRAWFDIISLDRNATQDVAGIRQAQQSIEALIRQTINAGIPSDKIIIGGFSQGGALALHLAIRHEQKLAGAIGLSTYLPIADSAPAEKHQNNANLPIFLAHGTQDNIVPLQFGEVSHQVLDQLGYPVTWKTYPIGHTVCAEEIQNVSHWIQRVLE